jgi:hypothetical protein
MSGLLSFYLEGPRGLFAHLPTLDMELARVIVTTVKCVVTRFLNDVDRFLSILGSVEHEILGHPPATVEGVFAVRVAAYLLVPLDSTGTTSGGTVL